MPTPTDRARRATGMATQNGDDRPGTALSRVEAQVEQRIGIVKAMLPAMVDTMQNEMKAQQLIRDAITCVRQTPKLAEATQASFLGALMTTAQVELRPNVPALGQAWILPYKNTRLNVTEANFQLGYPGVTELGWRSGMSIMARTIYENERHEIHYGTEDRIVHVPILNPELRGAPIAHYAIAQSPNGRVWVVLSHEETLEARERSPGYKMGGSDNPWKQDERNRWPMCRKTAVLRLRNFIPKSSPQLVTLATAMFADTKVRDDVKTPDDAGNPLDQAVMRSAEEEPDMVQPERDAVDESRVIDAEPQDGQRERIEARTGRPRSKLRRSARRKTLIADIVKAHGARAAEALLAITHADAEHDSSDYATDEELAAAARIELPPPPATRTDKAKAPNDKPRAKREATPQRRELIAQIEKRHQSALNAALSMVLGAIIPWNFCTDEELSALLNTDPAAVSEWQLAQLADEQDERGERGDKR